MSVHETKFIQTITPVSNQDGSYTLKLSAYELTELNKGLKYMERQRYGSRKCNGSKQQILSLNIDMSVLDQNTQPAPKLTLNIVRE